MFNDLSEIAVIAPLETVIHGTL